MVMSVFLIKLSRTFLIVSLTVLAAFMLSTVNRAFALQREVPPSGQREIPPASPQPTPVPVQPAPVIQLPAPVVVTQPVVVQPAPVVVVQPAAPPAQPVTQNQNTQVTTVQNNRQTSTQNNNQGQSNSQHVSLSSSSSASGGSANVTVTAPTREITREVQVVQVAGVTTEVKQLPKTGLPALAWSALAFVPAGFKLRRFSKVKEDAVNNPNFLWEDRQFKVG